MFMLIRSWPKALHEEILKHLRNYPQILRYLNHPSKFIDVAIWYGPVSEVHTYFKYPKIIPRDKNTYYVIGAYYETTHNKNNVRNNKR